MTMTPKSLTRARKIIRECEESEKEVQKRMAAVVKDEMVELLHQLSLLPFPENRDAFYESLENFLIEELFST